MKFIGWGLGISFKYRKKNCLVQNKDNGDFLENGALGKVRGCHLMRQRGYKFHLS